MFKDMSDEGLDEAIRGLQNHTFLAAELRQTRGMAKNLRDLDIAIAIKRQRIRAGTWKVGVA